MLDLRFFFEEGFQVIPQLIPPKVIQETEDFLKKDVDATTHELLDFFKLKKKDQLAAAIVNFSKTDAFKNTDQATKLKLSGHFSLQTRLSPSLLNVAKMPSMLKLFESIFPNEKPRLHMPPTARFVLPGNLFAAVPPHQDVSYNTHVKDFFVLWVPFCDITDSKGGVSVFQGTNQPVTLPPPKGNDFWLEGVDVGNAEKIHCKMRAGDALLLNKWIVHASMPNLSDEARISTDFRFFYGDSEKHFYDYEKEMIVAPS